MRASGSAAVEMRSRVIKEVASQIAGFVARNTGNQRTPDAKEYISASAEVFGATRKSFFVDIGHHRLHPNCCTPKNTGTSTTTSLTLARQKNLLGSSRHSRKSCWLSSGVIAGIEQHVSILLPPANWFRPLAHGMTRARMPCLSPDRFRPQIPQER